MLFSLCLLLLEFACLKQIKFCENCKPTAESGKGRIGYLSGTVFALRFLKSPHGRHVPVSGFGTVCSGEEYRLLERRVMPNCNIC